MEDIIKEYKEKFGKKCYFAYKDNTTIGTLIGLKFEGDRSYWILDTCFDICYIPTSESITVL